MPQRKLKNIEEGPTFCGKRTKIARSQGRKIQITIEQEKSRELGMSLQAVQIGSRRRSWVIEYEDGTPATEAQMGFKWIFVLSLAFLQAACYRRMKWSVVQSRKLVLDVVN